MLLKSSDLAFPWATVTLGFLNFVYSILQYKRWCFQVDSGYVPSDLRKKIINDQNSTKYKKNSLNNSDKNCPHTSTNSNEDNHEIT